MSNDKQLTVSNAKYAIGQTVEHLFYKGTPGVILDADPTFRETDDIYESIHPEARPHKNQPFYRVLLTCSHDEAYVIYAPEHNLTPTTCAPDEKDPRLKLFFLEKNGEQYVSKKLIN